MAVKGAGMNRWIVYLMLTFVMAGCMPNSPLHVAAMGEDQLKEVPLHQLCNAYKMHRAEKVKAELIRRGDIADDEWDLIEARKIRIGMSQPALLASWGTPGIWGRVNRSVGSYGEHIQWVYRSCDRCSATYVYTENGIVTSWQD
jgi:hypothetical protein